MPALLRPRTPRVHRWLRAAALAGAPVLAGACADSLTGPSSVAGTYALVGIRGQGLPFTAFQGDYDYTATDGLLELRRDRTYRGQIHSAVVNRRTGERGSLDDVSTGTYVLSGDRITVRPDGGDDDVFGDGDAGTVSGSTATIGVYDFVRR